MTVADLEYALITFGDLAWGPWLLVLILGGGLYFLFLSRFRPFLYLSHSFALLTGKYDDDAPGDITHFQALSSALAGTIGMGNIAGVAVAIGVGGPGAVFWMWMTAVVGIATKFFTCTLAVMYRGTDSEGHVQGGPMYVITEGLGPRYRFLATFFCGVGIVGCLPLFQTNQLVQTIREVIFLEQGWITAADANMFNAVAGVLLAVIVAGVIFGGLPRIAAVAAKLVPSMTLLYVAVALYVLMINVTEIPRYLWLIIEDAFTGMAVAGGAIGTVIATGVRRGTFSNEAGIGTEALAHGAAKTNEPVREGLVAMVGPIIDTLVICTGTALVILMTGVWESATSDGVTMTSRAFEAALPGIGRYVLITCVFFFGITTIFSYTYYGNKCLGFLIGADKQHYYNYVIVVMIIFASITSLDAIIGLVDGTFALMAIPTMTSTVLLAPKVMEAARTYFDKLDRTAG